MSIEAISGIAGLAGSGKLNMSDADITMKCINQIIASKDLDGDGCLNVNEVGFTEELFNGIDSDADKKISSSELMEGLNHYQQNTKVFEELLNSAGAVQSASGTRSGNGGILGTGVDQSQLLQTLANTPEAQKFMADASAKLQAQSSK